VAANPFGGVQSPQQNPFGNQHQPSPSPQPFGVPTSAPNPFGQPSQPAPINPFGNGGNTAQQSQAPANPFTNGVQPSVQNTTPSNPFSNGIQSGFQSSAQLNTFMNGAQSSAQNHINSGLTNGGATSLSANTNFGATTHLPLESYSTKGPDGRLTSFKGQRVVYKEGRAGTLNPDGTWSDIWFPEGPPRFTSDAQMPDNEYDDTTRTAYEAMSKTGKFENAVMPLLPPKVEWISWDF
jgi:nucleoporin NUP42